MVKYHKSDGAWMRCHASVRPGAGVTDCPVELEGRELRHVIGLEGIAAEGGGVVRRWVAEDTYRETEVTPHGDGTFSAVTGKLKRVYAMDGKLIPLKDRVRAAKDAEKAEALAVFKLPSYVAASEAIRVVDELAALRELTDPVAAESLRLKLKPLTEDTASKLGKLTRDEDAWLARPQARGWANTLILTVKEAGYDNAHARRLMQLMN